MATGRQTGWEREWRDNVTKQLAENSETLARTAVALERLSNRWDEHDRRIEALESQPANARANISSYGAVSIMAVTGLIALLSLIITLTAHLSYH